MITMVGWLVLVTLLVLIWHLLSVTRPILNEPVLQNEYEFSATGHGKLLLAGQFNHSHIYFFEGDDCRVQIFDTLDFFSQPYNQFPTGQKSDLLQSTCQKSQKLLATKTGVYQVLISQTGILRIHRFDPTDNHFKQQIFSLKIPDFTFDEPRQNWQATLHDGKLSLLLAMDTSDTEQTGVNAHTWRFLKLDLQSRRIETEAVLTEATPHLTLAENKKLDITYADNKIYLLPEFSEEQWQEYRTQDTSQIQQLISLSTHRSVLLIDEHLNLEKWSILNLNGEKVLQKIFSSKITGSKYRGMAHIEGDLVVLLVDNTVVYFNATTGEITNSEELNFAFQDAWFFNHNIVFQLSNNKETTRYVAWSIENLSATISWQSLWAEVWYDGYPEPDYVWQTSSASDEMQAKYSLVPLLMGSIKAAFLALIVAIPLAIGSAIYTAYYAGPRIRKVIKPYVEVLEAIPSVVIGFIAAIWLLPVSANYIIATFLFIVITPFIFALFLWLNETRQHLFWAGWELVFFGAVMLLYFAIFQFFVLENQALKSLFSPSGSGDIISIELKNTFVLALALGIAIVPTVFTIAEDAIYQVPRSMPLASFALGATRSQTLTRIVVKIALPGIISAIMLGFARAVGETMIVLMVSGNTPVADWDILEGIRTMTANLAIELPEAQPGSIHYQVLFLVALLLFVFTFVFNTLAEFLRLNLRSRYRL